MRQAKEWDAFICHASEDKKDFVDPFAHRLRDSGLSVWYDVFSLKLGDSLLRKIDEGLAFFGAFGDGYSLSRCRIINNILARPQLRECLHTRFCSVAVELVLASYCANPLPILFVTSSLITPA